MTTQELAAQALNISPPSNVATASDAGFFNVAGFELMQRVATAFSKSSLVPKDYQNNLPNCMIALSIAHRVGCDPLMVMQNLVIVHGRPTWSSQFLIATANACGRFTAIRFEFFGAPNTDEWGCRAWAIEKSTQEKLIGSDVTIGTAKKEGWYQKTGSKWQTIPQQMLMYRSGSWWVRAYAPELSLGLHTADEAIDILDASPRADGSFSVDLVQAARDLGEPVPEPETELEAAAIEPGPAPADALRQAEELVTRAMATLKVIKTKADLDEFAAQTRATIKDEWIDEELKARLIGEWNSAVMERLRTLGPTPSPGNSKR